MKTVLRKVAPATLVSEQEGSPVDNMSVGDEVLVDIKLSRNVRFHKKAFALINVMYDAYDFERHWGRQPTKDQFRHWLSLKAGAVEPIINSDGYFRVLSWAFDAMDQVEFDKVYQDIITVGVEELGQDWLLKQDWT